MRRHLRRHPYCCVNVFHGEDGACKCPAAQHILGNISDVTMHPDNLLATLASLPPPSLETIARSAVIPEACSVIEPAVEALRDVKYAIMAAASPAALAATMSVAYETSSRLLTYEARCNRGSPIVSLAPRNVLRHVTIFDLVTGNLPAHPHGPDYPKWWKRESFLQYLVGSSFLCLSPEEMRLCEVYRPMLVSALCQPFAVGRSGWYPKSVEFRELCCHVIARSSSEQLARMCKAATFTEDEIAAVTTAL
jgi:hypothetical protein